MNSESLQMSAPPNLERCKLYTFIDTAYLDGRDPGFVCRELCEGGSDIIQLRAKNESKERIKKLAEIIQPIATRYKVHLVLNDHPEMATEMNIPFCHLGQEDFFDNGYTHTDQLKTGEFSPLIGLSTHAPDQAQRAIRAQPAYIAIGPVYATPTKPTAPAVTLDYVKWARDHVSTPWFAIGGINESNVKEVLNAGATRICVVSAILNKKNIRSACEYFKNTLSEGKR